jgi:hypothetical protein
MYLFAIKIPLLGIANKPTFFPVSDDPSCPEVVAIVIKGRSPNRIRSRSQMRPRRLEVKVPRRHRGLAGCPLRTDTKEDIELREGCQDLKTITMMDDG